jgi:uncharacterized protein with von Willebrand factor type A (vWA) domain
MNLDHSSKFLIGFTQFLRESGFTVSSDRTISFLQAIRALGPRTLLDIRRAALAIFGPEPERQDEFNRLFDQYFLGKFDITMVEKESGEEALVSPSDMGDTQVQESDQENLGELATTTGLRNQRRLSPSEDGHALRRFSQIAVRRLPARLSHRSQPARAGKKIDRARTMRKAIGNDGEVLNLFRKKRRDQLRSIVLLVDISGSMKSFTDNAIRFAHVLSRLPTKVEVFALGTELTRITPALRLQSEAQALIKVSGLIQDIDGGTRLGACIKELISTPRYASHIRGSLVITLSDGLEIGASDVLFEQVGRLYKLSFAHLWLTPLAENENFVPQTEALQRIAPFIDAFSSAKSISHICRMLLGETQTKEVA